MPAALSHPFDLTGRVAIVTGANTGIGQAIAVALAQAGANVACVGRTAAEETAAQIRDLGRRAVVIDHGAIDFAEQFECTLHQPDHQASASTLIHGIAPSEVARGVDPAEGLLDFMEFVGSSPLLAFHAGFDQRMLARALRQSLGYRLQHSFFDVAEIAPLLCPQARIRQGGLDDWVAEFGLQVHQRHNASADALVTAELALMLFSKARRQGIDSLCELERQLASRRRRQHAM